MKKAAITLLIPLLLLVSCGRAVTAEELACEVQAKYLGAEELTMNAAVTWFDDGGVYDFALVYSGGATCGTITVKDPPEIAGITAEVDVTAGTVTFSDMILPYGDIGETGFSPAGAIPTLLKEWQTGVITLVGFEPYDGTDALMIETAITDGAAARTWFDRDTLLPIAAEVRSVGVTVLRCDFGNITVEGCQKAIATDAERW